MSAPTPGPIGRLVVLAFGGGWGSQVARIAGRARPDGRVLVQKWRRQGRKWTQPTLVLVSQLRGDVDPGDARLREMERHGAFKAEGGS